MKNKVIKVGILTLTIIIWGLIGLARAETIDSLFTTYRASKIGDIVIVNIYESSIASQSTNTSMGKQTQTGGEITSFFGQSGVTLPAWGWTHGGSFDGSGSTEQQGTIIATITVSVVEVFPNNNLYIRGKRFIQVNQEEQMISIEGIISPHDIDENNTIHSTQIADSQIRYESKGPLKENQRPGLLSRILNFLGLI